MRLLGLWIAGILFSVATLAVEPPKQEIRAVWLTTIYGLDWPHRPATSEREYQANNKKLISLEPRFPDVSAKNEWLLSQILGIFKAANITPQMEGTQTEDTSNSSYVVAALRVNADMSFPQFGEFLAGVENKKEFVKISEFSLAKATEPDKLGQNKVSIRFNTIFPKEKIAKSLFKDYDKIMKEMKEKEQN